MNHTTTPSKQRLALWVSLLIYVVLTVAMTWPMILRLDTHLLGRGDTDIFNVYWSHWWVKKALLSGQNPYFTPFMIYPVGFDLSTFAFSPFLSALAMPLSLLFSDAATYNLVALLTTVLACLCADLLVRYLTGNPWAALIAGLTLGFGPPLVGERLAHLNLSAVFWIPLTALLLTRLMREGKTRDALLWGVSIALAVLTRLQTGALVAMFNGVCWVALALFEGKRWSRAAWLKLLLAGAVAAILLAPLSWHILGRLSQPDGESLVRGGAARAQTDLLAYVTPPMQHPILGRWTEPSYTQRLFRNAYYWAYLGLTPLALGIYALCATPKKAAPWLLTGLCFVVLAMGPLLRVNGTFYPSIKLPYSLAEKAFSTIGFDLPNRFNLAVMPALSVLVGLACARIKPRWLLAALGALILFEFLTAPMPLMALPEGSPFYDQIAADGEDYALVDLPFRRGEGDLHRYYQTLHGKAMVGAWGHRVPPAAFSFIEGNPLLAALYKPVEGSFDLPASLQALSQANIRYVVLHKNQLRAIPQGTESLLLSIKPVFEDDQVYVLPTDVDPIAGMHTVHSWEGDLALVQPTLRLSGGTLHADLIWVWMGDQSEIDACQITVTNPQGNVVAQASGALPPTAAGPAWQGWELTLPPALAPGVYQIDITPFSGARAMPAWTTTRSLLSAQDGSQRALLGREQGVSFEAPIEMLGYRVQVSGGILWLDTYWRPETDHEQAYSLFVQLQNPITDAPIVRSSDDAIQEMFWSRDKVVHERRVIAVSGAPQGQYQLVVGLYYPGQPNDRIDAFDRESGAPLPGSQIILDQPVLVLPRLLEDTPIDDRDRIVVFADDGDPFAQGLEETPRARVGELAELLGYSASEQPLREDAAPAITFYWDTIASRAPEADYTVFVHVMDEQFNMVAQHDGQPVRGTRPTSTWQPGDKVVDTHQLVWLMPGYSGPATVAVGFYDLHTGERLPAYSPQGERLPDDRIVVGQVQVGR